MGNGGVFFVSVILTTLILIVAIPALVYANPTESAVFTSSTSSVCNNNNICEIGERDCYGECTNLVNNPGFDNGLGGWKAYGFARPQIIGGKLYLENNGSGTPGVYQEIRFSTPSSSSIVVSYDLNVLALSSNSVASLDLGVYYEDGTKEFFYQPIKALTSDLNNEVRKEAVFNPKSGKKISFLHVLLLAYYAPANISFDNIFVALAIPCNNNNICDIGERVCSGECTNLVSNPNFDDGLNRWKAYGFARPQIIGGKLYLENNGSRTPGVYQEINFSVPTSSSIVVSYDLNVSALSSNSVASLDLGVYYEDGTKEFFYQPIKALSSDLNKEVRKDAVFNPKSGKKISFLQVLLLAYYAPANISFDNVFMALAIPCNNNNICDIGENLNNCPFDCSAQYPPERTVNLITNHGFEESYGEGLLPVNWIRASQLGGKAYSSKVAKSGSGGVVLKDSSNDTPSIVSSNFIRIDPSVRYNLSGWVMGLKGSERAYIGLRYYNETFNPVFYSNISSYYSYPALGGQVIKGDWELYSGIITGTSSAYSNYRFPAGTKYVKIYLAGKYGSSGSPDTGEIYFDNITFTGTMPKMTFVSTDRDFSSMYSQNSEISFRVQCISGSCGEVNASIHDLSTIKFFCGEMLAGNVCNAKFVIDSNASIYAPIARAYSDKINESKQLPSVQVVSSGCGNNICEISESPSSCQNDCSYHPLLYFNKTDVEELKNNIELFNVLGFTPRETLQKLISESNYFVYSDYSYSANYTDKLTGDAVLYNYTLSSNPPLRPDYHRICCPWTNIGMGIEYGLESLSLAYILTGDEQYFLTAKDILNKISQWDAWASWTGWGNYPDLSTTALARGASIAYDVFYDKLSLSERETIRLAIKNKSIDPLENLLKDPWLEIKTPYVINDNFHTELTSALGISALTLMHEEDTNSALAIAKNHVNQHFEVQDPSGGMYEGMSYGATIYQMIKFLHALKRNTGEDYFSIPFMQKFWDYPVAMSHSGRVANLNDASENQIYIWYGVYAYAEQNLDVPFAGWFLEKNSAGTHIYDLNRSSIIWLTGNIKPIQEPSFLSKFFPDSGYASLRSNWKDNSPVLFFTTGYNPNKPMPPYPHAQYDKNSFIIVKNGKWFASDNNYGQPETFKHNSILADGQGQDTNFAGNMADFYSNSAFDYTVGEASSAYASLSAPLIDGYGGGIFYVTPEETLKVEGQLGKNTYLYQRYKFDVPSSQPVYVSYKIKASSVKPSDQTLGIKFTYSNGSTDWIYNPLRPSDSDVGTWVSKEAVILPGGPVKLLDIAFVNFRANSSVEFDSVRVSMGSDLNVALDFPYKKLNRFERTAFFMKPDTFIISDKLVGEGIGEYSWLMHSKGNLSWLSDKFTINFTDQPLAYGTILSDKQLTRSINSVVFPKFVNVVSDLVNSTYLNVTFPGPNASILSVINFGGDISTTGNIVYLQNGLSIVQNGTYGVIGCNAAFCTVGNSSWFIIYQGNGLSLDGQSLVSSDKAALFSRIGNKVYISTNEDTTLLFYADGILTSGANQFNSANGVISLALAKGKYEFDYSSD